MARRTPVVLAVAATVAVGLGFLVPRAIATPPAAGRWVEPPAAPAPAPAGQVPQGSGGGQAVSVNVDFSGEFLGWAMHDRKLGTVSGDNTSRTSSTESMIKVWLVADYLRTHGQPSEYHLKQASEAIRWSDDNAAQLLYEANGGNESVQRLITMCGLVDTTIHDGWWSRTQMSPRDALKLGACIVDGTAAGPQWTEWLLGEMRSVQGTIAPEDQERTRGGGRWGIIDGVPAEVAGNVALKNGWTDISADGNWHLNCLALTGDWTISVMMRYPSERGLSYGAEVCESIARQLLARPEPSGQS